MEADTDLIFSDTDYSNERNWLRLGGNLDKKADIFVVYPTLVFTSNVCDAPFVRLESESMRSAAKSWLFGIDDIISPQANVFSPFYRQLNGVMLTKYPAREMFLHTNQTPRDDIFTAFDYYLTEINKGERPFVLFGHSQGSQLVMELATVFLGSEKYGGYNKNHIITYAIGSPFTQREICKNINLKFSSRKDDTGVIVSWNGATVNEAALGKYENFLSWKDGVLVANPVSWETNENPESVFVSSITLSERTIEINTDIVVKAEKEKGVLIIDADETKFPNTPPAVSKFHTSEILFFADSIKRNIKDRIDAFAGKNQN
ncbi:MAG: DUF3089 domain-containing protein [Chitinispirillales bacterium]|jgi:hypothetical protein|nr:DUF3089 domain-containing protein [Chitinispirillales bacterium]